MVVAAVDLARVRLPGHEEVGGAAEEEEAVEVMEMEMRQQEEEKEEKHVVVTTLPAAPAVTSEQLRVSQVGGVSYQSIVSE